MTFLPFVRMKTNCVNTVTNINTAYAFKVPHQAYGDLYSLLGQINGGVENNPR
jgi:hypothetical protein